MKKLMSFIIIIYAFLLILTGCSGRAIRDGSVAGPVTGSTEIVKSYPAGKDFRERPATLVRKPAEFISPPAEQIVFSDADMKVLLYAKQFAQGNACYAEVIFSGEAAYEIKKLSFNGVDFPFTKTAWGCRGIFAIDPEAKPGDASFDVEYMTPAGQKKIEGKVVVRDVDYPVAKGLLDLGKFSDKTYTLSPERKAYIEECEKLREKAFSSVSDDYVTNVLSHPRDMHKVTGDYWKKRTYAEYKKKGKKKVKVAGHKSFHRGLDLKGCIGAPVYSMADGKVVLSRKMFYEGNMVVVDHGNKIFSYYMHMDSLEVKEGDLVTAGTLVGHVGSTGTSTGPHLHVALSIRGVHVNPLSLLSLPVSR